MSHDVRAVPKEEWHDFLEQLTKEHERDNVTIEVVGRDFGDALEAEALPLDNVEYDHKDDVVVVAVGGRDGRHPVVLRHFIYRPKTVWYEPSPSDGSWVLDVVTVDRSETIIASGAHPANV